MEILIADRNGRELGCLNTAKRVDVNVGNENKFHIDVNINDFDKEKHEKGNQIFVAGEEYGGQIEQYKIDTEDGTLTLIGDTWRGRLSKKIIEPPEDSDYLVVSGEANKVMASLLGNSFEGQNGYQMIRVSAEDDLL